MASTSIGRLHYFRLRGRGELIRLVCAAGRVPLEEVVEPMGREFLARKPLFPFGQLPMMEIDGKTYAQSMALARYAARQAGLYPRESDIDALTVDMVMDACADIHGPVIRATFLERDAERKAKQLKRLVDHTLPALLGGLHARVDGPFFLGAQLSVADLAVFDVLTNALVPKREELPIDYAATFPKLVALTDRVRNEPAIAAYLRDRGASSTPI